MAPAPALGPGFRASRLATGAVLDRIAGPHHHRMDSTSVPGRGAAEPPNADLDGERPPPVPGSGLAAGGAAAEEPGPARRGVHQRPGIHRRTPGAGDARSPGPEPPQLAAAAVRSSPTQPGAHPRLHAYRAT